MREIKFRAWDSVLHEYRKIGMNSGKQNLGMGFEATGGIGSNITTIYHSVGDIVEQYTGLKDFNGVEIYENDILKVKSDDGAFYVATVKWLSDDGYPGFDLEGVPAAAWHYDSNALATILESSIETCEVIGNVHENIELLEVEE